MMPLPPEGYHQQYATRSHWSFREYLSWIGTIDRANLDAGRDLREETVRERLDGGVAWAQKLDGSEDQ